MCFTPEDNIGAIIDEDATVVYYWPYGMPEDTLGALTAGEVKKDLLPGKYLFLIKDYNKTAKQ